MSGLEVAALVLGVFPLVISGLEHLQRGLKPVLALIGYKGEILALHSFVSSEYTKFRNSLELLLQPIVPPAELRRILEDPEDKGWGAPHLRGALRRRLGTSEAAFFEALSVIEESIQELNSALEEQNCRSRIHFCFVGTSRRTSTKKRLRRANEDLASFVEAAHRLGSSRESRLCQDLEANLLRDELTLLHGALHEAPWRCKCSKHLIRLAASGVVPEISAQSALEGRKPVTICLDTCPTTGSRIDIVLRALHVELGSPNVPKGETMHSGASSCSMAVVTNTLSSSSVASQRRRSRNIADVCRLWNTAVTMRTMAGYLETSEEFRMAVYHLPPSYHYKIGSGTVARTLGDTLGASSPSTLDGARQRRHLRMLRPSIRRQLACKFGVLYLQLQSTPWVPSGFDKQAVCFLSKNRPDTQLDFTVPFVSHSFRPILDRRCSMSARSAGLTSASATESNLSRNLLLINQNRTEGLFALGKLLIELALDSRLEDLYAVEDMDDGKVTELTEYLAVQRLLHDVYEVNGYMYGEAVRRCIEGVDVREKGVEDPRFRRAFIKDVVIPLQDTSSFLAGHTA